LRVDFSDATPNVSHVARVSNGSSAEAVAGSRSGGVDCAAQNKSIA